MLKRARQQQLPLQVNSKKSGASVDVFVARYMDAMPQC